MLSPKYIGLVFLLTIPLMGMRCSGAQYKVSGECSTGGNCTVRGEISGTLPLAPKGDFAAMMASVVGSVDAGSFYLDVSDSTVTVPASGYVTVGLVDSGTGTTLASRVFPWIRSGTVITLGDPEAVNAWATSNGGIADSVKYDLHQFQAEESPGWNTLAIAAEYEGATEAFATTTWKGAQFCPNDPKRKNGGNPNGIRFCP